MSAAHKRLKGDLTFWQWLKAQQRQDDIVGDLARDAAHDRAYKGNTLAWWEKHLESRRACPGAQAALQEAWGRYLRVRQNLSTTCRVSAAPAAPKSCM